MIDGLRPLLVQTVQRFVLINYSSSVALPHFSLLLSHHLWLKTALKERHHLTACYPYARLLVSPLSAASFGSSSSWFPSPELFITPVQQILDLSLAS